MLVSLIAIKLIGPEKLGLWQAALLVKPYISFLQLGLTQGLGRQIPFLYGQNREEKVHEYASTSQFVTTIYSSAFSLLTLVFVFWLSNNLQEKLIYLTAGVFISTLFIDNYLSSTYRSSRSFQNLSRVYFISSIFEIVLIPLIFFLGFNGYLILLFCHSTFSTILLIYYRPIRVKSKFKKKIYIENIKIGFPMLILNFLRNIPDTYPKVLILFFLSTTALGLTSPANAAFTVFSILPMSLAKYIHPRMTYDYGMTLNAVNLWKTGKKIGVYLTGFGFIGLIGIFFVPYIIENYFDKYIGSISITVIAIVIGFFRMYSILFNIFNTLKSYSAQFKVSLARNLLYLILPLSAYFLSSENEALTYIFFGALVAEILSTLIMFYYLYKVTHTQTGDIKLT